MGDTYAQRALSDAEVSQTSTTSYLILFHFISRVVSCRVLFLSLLVFSLPHLPIVCPSLTHHSHKVVPALIRIRFVLPFLGT